MEGMQIMMASIILDQQLLTRTGIDQTTFDEYLCVAMEAKEWPFPPIRLVNGWLVDGFHRYAVAKELGMTSILAIRTMGEREDAIREACKANADHGLRRSPEDKRRAVDLALTKFPDMTTREIAALTKTSHAFAGKRRRAKARQDSETFPTQKASNDPSNGKVADQTNGDVSRDDTAARQPQPLSVSLVGNAADTETTNATPSPSPKPPLYKLAFRIGTLASEAEAIPHEIAREIAGDLRQQKTKLEAYIASIPHRNAPADHSYPTTENEVIQ